MHTLLIFWLLTTVSLSVGAPNPDGHAQLCGTVREVTGNRMPGPTAGAGALAGRPVVRKIVVFPVLSLDKVTQDDDGFFTGIPVKPVATAQSDQAGKFCLRLPAGHYSVLVREPKGLYANLFDTKNRINAVLIQPGKTTNLSITISHGASY